MGAGLTIPNHAGAVDPAVARAAPASLAAVIDPPVTPLTAEENVPAVPAAATAPTPLPPKVAPTANPRQHLAEAHTATPPTVPLSRPSGRPSQHAALSVAAASPAVDLSDRATPPPMEDSRPPPSVVGTAVKRRLESADADAAVTNPNADFSNIDNDDDVAGAASYSADEEDEAGGSGEGLPARRSQGENSPSPDVPEQAETNTATATAGGVVPLSTAVTIADGMAYRPITRSASPGQALGHYDGLPLTSVQQVLEAKHKVYRICLTGGPCAGKSTMLSAMQAKLPQRTGFRVMCVPEAATLLVTGGMQWDADLTVAQQSALLRTQLALEDQFYAVAVATGVPTIIVSDRGTMDGRAFCSDAQFQEILRSVGCTVDVLRDRYDAVLHMVTAANGAEEFYNLDNPARYEDLDGARASDLRLQEMYVGHHMFRLLDNSTTFEDKIERGLQVVGQVVHKEQCAPSTPSYYLVRRCPETLPIASASYTTYTTVLSNSQMSDIRLLVKREMADGSSMHFFKSVRDVTAVAPSAPSSRALSRSSAGASLRSSVQGHAQHHHQHRQGFTAPRQQHIESAQRISSREYNSLRQHRDRARAEVVMEATHFIYDGANYELTTLLAPSWAAGRQTLTVESCTPSAALKSGGMAALRLPPFLEVDREVPVESLTTAFLISHRETGALYTSLAFAPVFSRAVVTALGAHADTENILNSTLSTPRGHSALRGDTSALSASPVDKKAKAQDGKTEVAPAAAKAAEEEKAAAVAAPPVRRGLAPLSVNTAPMVGSTMSKSTPQKAVDVRLEQQLLQEDGAAPYFLGGSVSVQQPRNVVTPSRFSLSGEEPEEGDEGGRSAAPQSGEHAQPERRVFARDPLAILPPIETKKLVQH